jgi:ribosome biogenesis protein NSA2
VRFLSLSCETVGIHDACKPDAEPEPYNVLTPTRPSFSTFIDSEGQARAKALSNMIKQKRKEKAGKWAVPLPKVKAVGDNEVMKVMRTGKRQSTWLRLEEHAWPSPSLF